MFNKKEQDKLIMSKFIKAENVSEYIDRVSKITNNGERYVYRGENKSYVTSCVPNIFREERRLSQFNFERNILNKIRSEGLDNKKEYLLTAIEAQHGGFPSRLLDISYNSLIALHFAVTPFYTQKNDVFDDYDGYVFIIKIENMVSPSSEELEALYSKELLNKNSLKNNCILLAHQHRMVDFYSKNRRVEAQQGGFILFYGNEYRPLPEYLIQRIVIPAKYKKQIRSELERFFNLSNAFVYPESNNLVKDFLKLTDNYSKNESYNFYNEIKEVFVSFEKNVNFFLEMIIQNEQKSDEKLIEIVINAEDYIKNFSLDFYESMDYLKRLFCSADEEVDKVLSEFEQRLNCEDLIDLENELKEIFEAIQYNFEMALEGSSVSFSINEIF